MREFGSDPEYAGWDGMVDSAYAQLRRYTIVWNRNKNSAYSSGSGVIGYGMAFCFVYQGVVYGRKDTYRWFYEALPLEL